MTAIKGIDLAKNIISCLNPMASLVALATGGVAVFATLSKTIANETNVLKRNKRRSRLTTKVLGVFKANKRTGYG